MLKNYIPSVFSVISLIIARLLRLFQDGRQKGPKWIFEVILFSGFWLVIFLGFRVKESKFTDINYVRKFNMAKIQDGRQNCMKIIYLALKAYIQRNLSYDTAFYRFLGSRNPKMPKWIASENSRWRKSKMAAKMASKTVQNGNLNHKILLEVLLLSGTWLVICPFLGFRGQGIQICKNGLRQKIQYGGNPI